MTVKEASDPLKELDGMRNSLELLLNSTDTGT